MQELQQRILQDGDILPGGVVRVERFLNHRVDTALARHIGQAFADAFRNDQITASSPSKPAASSLP